MTTEVILPTLTLGDYLHSHPNNFRNTLASFLIDPFADSFRLRPFNPAIVLPSRYIIDVHGRTQANPAFRIAHQARYGFYEDEVRGSRVGERLATGGIGEVDAGVLRFCQDRGIPLSPVVTTGIEATRGNLSPFEVARLDALYVAKGFETAWDKLIAPASTPGIRTPAPLPPPVTIPDSGGLPSIGTTPGLDPTSAVIYDLRQQLAAQVTLTEAAVKRELSLRARLTSLLGKYKPPVRGGGAPTMKWREFWNAVSTEVEKR